MQSRHIIKNNYDRTIFRIEYFFYINKNKFCGLNYPQKNHKMWITKLITIYNKKSNKLEIKRKK